MTDALRRRLARRPSVEPDAGATDSTHSSSGRRPVLVLTAVAVVCLVAGLGFGQLVRSPAQAAADMAPPSAGLITYKVDRRVISNDVPLRASVEHTDSVDLVRAVGARDAGTPAVVTGHLPEAGAKLGAGQVVLEVAGRPVIALAGDLPVYRDLGPGMSGPDVVQLRHALRSLGINAGNAASDGYDAALAAGVEALYSRVGYPPPEPDAAATAAVQAAQGQVTAAEQGVAAAQTALDSERSKILGRDTASAEAALATANQTLADAHTALSAAQAQALTPLPASEVVYVAALPRWVDKVVPKLGDVLQDGVFATVSGAGLDLRGTVAAQDAAQLAVGASGTATLDGQDYAVTLTQISDAQSDGGGTDTTRKDVVLAFGTLTDEQVAAFDGKSVRVTIPISSTGGAVLAVPLAALSAGPDGSSRVQVLDGSKTRMVTVTTGLAADGYVEIKPGGALAVGDLVVLGTKATTTSEAGG